MRLEWDKTGERTYETGCDHGVLYPQKNGAYNKGVAWNGITSVTESPSGAEDTALWADNMKYLNIKSAEQLGLTLACYMSPDEWDECNGEEEVAKGVKLSQQKRNTFGLSYRTKIGNDTENTDYGYKLHLVYGCSASPSERAYNTINDSPEGINFSYTISTTPVPIEGHKPSSLITIDTTELDETGLAKLQELEAILYGQDGTISYNVLSAEPTDWATKYTNYYTKDGTNYVPVTDATAPTFASDTYYEKVETGGVDARLPLPQEIISMFAKG